MKRVIRVAALAAIAVMGVMVGTLFWWTAPPDGLTRHQFTAMSAELRRFLADYESARFEYPQGHRPISESEYAFCFRINAKNRFGAYTGFQDYRVEFFRDSVLLFEGHDSSCPQRRAALRAISPLNDMIYSAAGVPLGECRVDPASFEATKIGMPLREVRAVFGCVGTVAEFPANEVFETATITFGKFKPSAATFRFDRDGKAVMRFYTP